MNINDLFPSRYLKASDAEDEDLVLTIQSVTQEEVGTAGNTETKPVLWFEETEKGLVLNKTNATSIAQQYGGDTNAWTGKRISLFATEVDFQGKQTLALRVRLRKARSSAAAPAAVAARDSVGSDPALWEENATI